MIDYFRAYQRIPKSLSKKQIMRWCIEWVSRIYVGSSTGYYFDQVETVP